MMKLYDAKFSHLSTSGRPTKINNNYFFYEEFLKKITLKHFTLLNDIERY